MFAFNFSPHELRVDKSWTEWEGLRAERGGGYETASRYITVRRISDQQT
jgi:hypothetical protein